MILLFTVSVDVLDEPAVSVTLVGIRVRVGPEGADEADKLTVPAKPNWLLIVRVAVPETPVLSSRDCLSMETEKSETEKTTVTLWTITPAVAVTLI